MAEERNLRKVRQGIVVSDKMDKTVVVAVERKVPHKLYKKALKSTTKFKAHKRWRVEKIVARQD